MPEGMGFADAAAAARGVPRRPTTRSCSRAELKAGETVLVHAVASGVGSAAALLCRAAGARVVGTGRSATKLERPASGASGARCSCAVHTAALRRGGARRRRAAEARTSRLDLVGGDYVPETLEALAPQGRHDARGARGGRPGPR